MLRKVSLLDVDGQLSGASAKQISADPDVIAEIEQLVEVEALVADGVFLDVDLQLLPALLQVRESGLAHEADGHDAPRDANVHPRLLELLGSLGGVLGQDLLERCA